MAQNEATSEQNSDNGSDHDADHGSSPSSPVRQRSSVSMEEEIYGVAVPTIMNSKSKLSALQKDFPWLNYVEGEG
eukprot:gene10322-25503_t